MSSSAGMLSAPGDFFFHHLHVVCFINTSGFAFQYAGIWLQFVIVEFLAILSPSCKNGCISRELLLSSITVALCCCFLVSFFSVSKAFLLLLSFMSFSMLSHCCEIYSSFAFIISILMVRLTVWCCSTVSGVKLFVFFMFLLISQRSRMPLLIHSWIFFLSLPSTSLAVSCTTLLMMSVRTFMSSSKRFRAVNLLPILASKC